METQSGMMQKEKGKLMEYNTFIDQGMEALHPLDTRRYGAA
jgi:hypothetical protein